MKKFLAMMMAMMMVFSAAACGGGEEEAAPAEPAMVEISNGYVTMMIPEAYDEVQQMDGMVGAGGPGGSAVISDPVEADIAAADVTEDLILMLVSESYSDVEMLGFDNPVDIDGTEGVCAVMTGTSNDMDLTLTFLMAFYMLDDVMYEQNICIAYETGYDTDMETYLIDVVDSIVIG